MRPLTERNAEKLVKKLLGENEVEAVLQRSDRLTQDEARTAAAARILDVVYGLFQNMKVVTPMLAEDREQYFGPRGTADVRLECEWDAGDDPEMERHALPNFAHETAEDVVRNHRTLKPLTTPRTV